MYRAIVNSPCTIEAVSAWHNLPRRHTLCHSAAELRKGMKTPPAYASCSCQLHHKEASELLHPPQGGNENPIVYAARHMGRFCTGSHTHGVVYTAAPQIDTHLIVHEPGDFMRVESTSRAKKGHTRSIGASQHCSKHPCIQWLLFGHVSADKRQRLHGGTNDIYKQEREGSCTAQHNRHQLHGVMSCTSRKRGSWTV